MAFFNANVDTLLTNDLAMGYEDMAFGGQYAALIGIFKKEDVTGDAKKVTLKRDLGAGQSATATTAYTNATLAGRNAFVVTPYKTYGFSVIPLDQSAFTEGNDQAVANLLLDESATAMDSCKMQMDQALAGDGSGCVATIVSNTGGGPYVLTLASVGECNRLTVGAVYQSKTTPFTAGLDSGTFTVSSVQSASKTCTVAAAGGWTPSNTHSFGLQGTVAASASPVVWPGIPGWIPPAASRPVSTSDSFFNVNRSTNESKLAGLYLNGVAMGILEGVNQLAFMIADVPGAKPDTVIMSFKTQGKVVIQLQTQGRYEQGQIKGAGIDVFYDSVRIVGPNGKMDIISSSNWPETLVAVIDKSTWYCGAPKNKPFVPATSNGNPIVEVPNDDTAVAKYRAQAIVWCDAPGHNGMLTIKA